ncbi:hypothetical protein F53441_5960 [Fusarium austroafricanum]|uniref:Uncharacterized protein n=1 Tax=Fusarium austroafricanum TaxID=2364996 RepID=A0A8H4KJS3_9HYPO|nr:hypothetical protein F53441_5960 [Fusarium austroafricanum]
MDNVPPAARLDARRFRNIYELGDYPKTRFPQPAIGRLDILFQALKYFRHDSRIQVENALAGLDIQNVLNLSVSLMDRIFENHRNPEARQGPNATYSMAVILQDAFFTYSALARRGEDTSELNIVEAREYAKMFENGGCSEELQFDYWDMLESRTDETGRVALYIARCNIPGRENRARVAKGLDVEDTIWGS